MTPGFAHRLLTATLLIPALLASQLASADLALPRVQWNPRSVFDGDYPSIASDPEYAQIVDDIGHIDQQFLQDRMDENELTRRIVRKVDALRRRHPDARGSRLAMHALAAANQLTMARFNFQLVLEHLAGLPFTPAEKKAFARLGLDPIEMRIKLAARAASLQTYHSILTHDKGTKWTPTEGWDFSAWHNLNSAYIQASPQFSTALSLFFGPGVASELADPSRRYALALDQTIFLPPVKKNGAKKGWFKVIPKATYNRWTKDSTQRFFEDVKEYLDASAQASSYTDMISGYRENLFSLFRPEQRGVNGQSAAEISRDTAYDRALLELELLHAKLGVPQSYTDKLRDALQKANQKDHANLDQGYASLHLAMYAFALAPLIPVAMTAAPLVFAIMGGEAATMSIVAGSGQLTSALAGQAAVANFGVWIPTAFALVNTAEATVMDARAGRATRLGVANHLIDSLSGSMVMGSAMAWLPVIAAGGGAVATATTGVLAVGLKVKKTIDLTVALGFVANMGMSGSRGVMACRASLQGAITSAQRGDIHTVNALTEQAYDLCFHAGIDLLFAYGGAKHLTVEGARQVRTYQAQRSGMGADPLRVLGLKPTATWDDVERRFEALDTVYNRNQGSPDPGSREAHRQNLAAYAQLKAQELTRKAAEKQRQAQETKQQDEAKKRQDELSELARASQIAAAPAPVSVVETRTGDLTGPHGEHAEMVVDSFMLDHPDQGQIEEVANAVEEMASETGKDAKLVVGTPAGTAAMHPQLKALADKLSHRKGIGRTYKIVERARSQIRSKLADPAFREVLTCSVIKGTMAGVITFFGVYIGLHAPAETALLSAGQSALLSGSLPWFADRLGTWLGVDRLVKARGRASPTELREGSYSDGVDIGLAETERAARYAALQEALSHTATVWRIIVGAVPHQTLLSYLQTQLVPISINAGEQSLGQGTWDNWHSARLRTTLARLQTSILDSRPTSEHSRLKDFFDKERNGDTFARDKLAREFPEYGARVARARSNVQRMMLAGSVISNAAAIMALSPITPLHIGGEVTLFSLGAARFVTEAVVKMNSPEAKAWRAKQGEVQDWRNHTTVLTPFPTTPFIITHSPSSHQAR